MDQPPPLRFRFFGGPSLFRGERELLLSPYQLYFLVVLYGHGTHGLSCRRMVRLLWDDPYDGRTRHRLRQLVYTIRQRTGAPQVVRRHQEQLLPSSDSRVVECDLIDPTTPNPPPPWAKPTEAFLVRLPDVLPSKALEDWVLGLRIGQERLAETATLDEAPPPEPHLVRPPGHPPSPLIERDVEMEVAWQAVMRPAGRWRTVVISGDAGIGKTRFLDELTLRLRREGHPAVRVDCHEAEREVSFNLLAELCEAPRLRDAVKELEEPWHSIIRMAFPAALGPAQAGGDTPARRPLTGPRVVLDALEHLFRMAVPRRGLTVLIDDFQWIDASSATALSFMRRRMTDLDLSLVITTTVDFLQVESPASSYVRSLAADADQWITLEPLPPAAVHELLKPYGDRLRSSEIRDVVASSGGVPLFAIELAHEMARTPPESREGGVSTTRSAESLYAQRERSLDPDDKHVLRFAAVFGRPVPHDALRCCVGYDPPRFQRAVHSLVRLGLLSVGRHDALSIRHQLIRGAVYERLDEESRQRYHRRIARYLSGPGHGLSAGEMATHFHRGGVPGKAHRYALLAAEDARERGAFQEAISMLEMASATAPTDATLFESLRQLGRLRSLQGSHDRAAEHFTACAEAADRMGDPALASHARLAALSAAVAGGMITSEALFRRLDVLEQSFGPRSPDYVLALDLRIRVADDELVASEAREALRRGDALLGEDNAPLTECLLQTLRTRHVCYGDPDTAVGAARSALRLVEEHDLPDQLASALKRFLVVLAYRGLLDGRESGRLIERAKSVFREKGDQRGLFDVLINYGVWLSDTGRFGEARRYFLEAGEIVRELEESPEYAVFACNMGEFHLYQHDYLAAKRYFKAAHRVGPSSRRTVRWVVAGGLGLCALHTGELSIVEELHGSIAPDEVLVRSPTFDPTPIALFRARRLELRHSPRRAADLLHGYGEALKERIVPAWMKVLLAELRLRRKHHLGDTRALAAEGHTVAERLGLVVRAREFSMFG